MTPSSSPKRSGFSHLCHDELQHLLRRHRVEQLVRCALNTWWWSFEVGGCHCQHWTLTVWREQAQATAIETASPFGCMMMQHSYGEVDIVEGCRFGE